MRSLSTGKRINSAADDAAGLGLIESMTAQVRGLNQAIRNLNDGINMMQTADGALVESGNMLQRMRELAVQSSNGTYSSTQRSYLQAEFSALSTQIDRVATYTKWNNKVLLGSTLENPQLVLPLAPGQTLLGGMAAIASGTTFANGQVYQAGATGVAALAFIASGASFSDGVLAITSGATLSGGGIAYAGVNNTFTFQAGQSNGQTIQVSIANMGKNALGIGGLDVTTATTAVASIDSLDSAIDKLNAQRSALGATMNQMTYGMDNITNISTNIAASRSTIQDTDYAQASTSLSKGQIVQQAATAMLAQANQQPQSILALLR